MADFNINLINNMGHDVRTSVSSILGLSALAGANIHDKERVIEYLNNITITARQLLDYVDEVLNSANMSNDDNMKEQKIDLRRLVEAIFAEEKQATGKHGKRIYHENDLPEGEIVLGDESRIGHIIRFIFMNTFGNIGEDSSSQVKISREILGETGVIKYVITCINKDRRCIVRQDSNISWFEQLQDDDIQLGLSVVRKMLNSMDGELSFYSEPELGNVAELSFCLKLYDGNANKTYYSVGEGIERFSKNLEGFLSEKRILIVEDNEINAEITRNVLEYMGAVVEWAINGADAIKLVDKSEENYYDMILMDLQMPELDGYAATSAIRKLNKKYTEKLPIVALTANVMVSNIKQAMDVGMDDYIIKPIEISSIEKVAKKFFG